MKRTGWKILEQIKESKMEIIRSVYALIVITTLLSFIYIAEGALNSGGGLLHFGLLFTLPILVTVAWYFMVKNYDV